MIRSYLATLALAFALSSAAAQSSAPEVSARLSADSIMIGDHFTIEVKVKSDRMQPIAFGEFETTKDNPLELITSHKIDTIQLEGRRIELIKRYTMSSYQEGRYNLGRMAVLYMDKNIVDTLYSADSLRLEVATFEIDSTSRAIYDLKPQRDLPFKFREIRGYVLYTLLGLVLLALLVLAALKIAAHFNHPVGSLFKPKPKDPPHIIAIKALEELHHKKLWQSNFHKSYYSSLTDIVRTYISERYEIAAMEMTSDEIIAAMRSLELPTKGEMEMRELLKCADLVKFAKAEPEADENERHYNSSYYFVEQTKIVEQSEDEEEPKI